MKEFIEKLIGRLEELYNSNDKMKKKAYEKQDWENFELFTHGNEGVKESIEIVNQLAEEYSKDQNWQTTRNYLDVKYFSKIRELSAKYNHPCENVPINFDWVFGLIEKIENQPKGE